MPPSNAPVQVGVIGLGNFTRLMHLPNIIRLPECRLRMLCDKRPEVLEATLARWPADHGTTDWRAVLDDPAIGAVLIAVRDDAQAELAVAALAAGKHVYVEKPVARSAAEAATVLAAQRRSGHRLAVGFNRRFAPALRLAREVLREAGGAYNIHLRMADDAWRWAASYPPGHLLRLDAGHLFDQLRWLCDCEAVSVSCQSSRPDDDCLTVRMADDCVASILLSGHATMDLPKDRMDVITRRGALVMDDFTELRTYGMIDQPAVTTFPGHSNPDLEFTHKHLMTILGASGRNALRRMTWELRQRVEREDLGQDPDAGEMRRYVERTLPNFMNDQGWIGSLREFFRGIVHDLPTDHATAADGLAAVQLTDAAYRSRAEGGQPIQVPPPYAD